MNTTREAPQKPPIPWVSGFIIVVSVAVHLVQIGMIAKGIPRGTIIFKLGALYAPLVREGQWWRLLTYAFVHGSLMHLGFNMLATYALGVPLERRIGTARFLPLSLATCLGSAAVIICVPRGAPMPTVGVSGVIFGWAGALLFLVSRAQMRELGKMLLLNAVISLLPGVSWQGHLGGFLFGVICGFLLRVDPARFSARVPILVGLGGVLSLWGAYR
ncbi:MAG: rhomboid family intramembrane serine protease [Polyangiales bacterium]